MSRARIIATGIVAFLVLTGVASAGSLTTIYARNNGGNLGGAVYFDVTVGPNVLTITGFDTNTLETVPFGFSVYTAPGTRVGNEAAPGAWTLVATGGGTGAGVDLPSAVALTSSFVLNAGTSYGMALVMSAAAGHDYTNGTGGNQAYANGDLSLAMGAASNQPFVAGTFDPRVWNGTIYYDVGRASTVPLPSAAWAGLGLIGVLGAVRRARRKAVSAN